MIIFVGSNPSNAAKDNSPFTRDTTSGRILHAWMVQAGITVWSHINVCDIKTPNNRPLNIKEIKEALPGLSNKLHGYTRVVALGKTATKALTLINKPFLELPHPSGCNRKLNDPDYVRQCIKELKEYAAE